MTITAINDDSISISFITPTNVKNINKLVQQKKADNKDPKFSEKLGKAYSLVLLGLQLE